MKIENHKLRQEFALPGRCEYCGIWCRKREGAHLVAKGIGGGGCLDLRINLISLGSSPLFQCSCHTKSHNDSGALNEAFLPIIAKREETTPEIITEVMLLLRRLIRPTDAELRKCLKTELSIDARALAVRELIEAGVLDYA